MKSRISPTSPKNRIRTKEIEDLYRSQPVIQKPMPRVGVAVVVTVVVAIVCTLGSFIGLRYLANRYPSNIMLRPFLSSTSTTERILISPERTNTNATVIDLRNTIEPFLGTILRKRDTGTRVVSDRLGFSTFITSDGVAVTVQRATFPETGDIVPSDRKNVSYSDLRIDPLTGISFVRSDSSTVPARFASSEEASVGAAVYIAHFDAYSSETSIVPAALSSLRERSVKLLGYDALTEYSDSLSRYMKLSVSLDQTWIGSAVFSENGHLVGLVISCDPSEGTLVVPIAYIKDVITSYATQSAIERPTLGVRYVDLAYTIPQNDVPTKGALIATHDQKKYPAIVPSSPAAKTGLQLGDIVTAVDSTTLNELNSIAEVLASYTADTKIALTVLRNGKQMTVNVTLGVRVVQR